MDVRRLRTPLVLAITAALLLPNAALAQTEKARELEARIAQLEAQVQSLLGAQQQQASLVQQQNAMLQTPAQLDAVKQAHAGGKTLPATSMPTKVAAETGFGFGGFIKVDAMVTSTDAGEMADGSAGRMFYLPAAIPVGASGESRSDLDTHAQFSRFWFASDGDVQGHKTRAYLEFDLFGGGMTNLGNQAATNTHGVTLRQAYVSWDKWLVGQTWSNFQDIGALPDAVDFVGPTEGTVFVRQAQLRYTRGAFSASLENPQTVVSAYRSATRIVSDDGNMPDITAHWMKKGDWGHVSVAGVVRRLQHDTAAAHARGNGFGLSISGKLKVSNTDDLRYMLTGGRGIGRYVGFALGPDGTLSAAGDALHNTGVLAGFVAWRHVFDPKLRGSLFYSRAQLDNTAAWTGMDVTRSAQSFHANLIYSPFPKLDMGAELIWGQRELESGADGDLRRIHTSVKYSF